MNLLDQPLSRIAHTVPGATRLLEENGLDVCGGTQTLREAAGARALDPRSIAEALEKLRDQDIRAQQDFEAFSVRDLVDHILEKFHQQHRVQLPGLITLARRVEDVHRNHEACPAGLADHLVKMLADLEAHMWKEENVLFPLLLRGQGPMAVGPIHVMRMEHEEHGASLKKLTEISGDMVAPAGACVKWRSLYAGLRTLRADLVEHISIENTILFERAQAGG